MTCKTSATRRDNKAKYVVRSQSSIQSPLQHLNKKSRVTSTSRRFGCCYGAIVVVFLLCCSLFLAGLQLAITKSLTEYIPFLLSIQIADSYMASVKVDRNAPPLIVEPTETYGAEGPVILRIAAGGAGQSGLIRSLAEAFIDE